MDKPVMSYVIESNRAFDHERGTNEKQSWFSSSFGFGRSLNRPYSWRLIAVAQSGRRNDRLKAVWLLANWKNMKGNC
jgi:hypothetical protein